jgi:Tsi6
MKALLITSKSKFVEILQTCLATARQHAAANPDDPFQKSILAQLEFMARCSAEDRPASLADLERINVGVIAVRTLEDTEPEYASLLSELDYAFRRWQTLPK